MSSVAPVSTTVPEPRPLGASQGPPATAPAMTARQWHRLRILMQLLVLGAVIAAYSPSLGGPFLFDDHNAIVTNQSVRSLSPWTKWLDPVRPLVGLSFAVNYAYGGLAPEGYHLVNLGLHALAAMMLLAVVRRTMRSPALAPRFASLAEPIAFAAAMWWAVHPLATQAVSYIVQRAESGAALGTLMCLYAMLRAASTPDGRRVAGWAVAAAVAWLIGLGFKAPAAVAPILGLLIIRTGFPDAWAGVKRYWPVAVGAGALAVAVVAWRVGPIVLAEGTNVGFLNERVTWGAYVASQPLAMLRYLQLTLLPVGLTFDYDWSAPPPWYLVAGPSIVVAAAGVATAIALWRRHPLGLVGAWFFLLLAPSSSVIPVADVIVEHRAYLPMAGVVTAIAAAAALGWRRWALGRGWSRRRMAGIAIAATLVLAAVLGGTTAMRNRLYASPVELWRDTTRKAPWNPRAFHNLSVELARSGAFVPAADAVQEALRLYPAYEAAHLQLGRIRISQQRFGEAETSMRRVLELDPGNADAMAMLGLNAARRGNGLEAKRWYARALEAEGDHAAAHNGLGAIAAREGDINRALSHFIASVRSDPLNPASQSNLAQALVVVGELDQAAAAQRSAVALAPGDPAHHNQLGRILAMQRDTEQAIAAFQTAVQLDPNYIDALVNLGRAYHLIGRYEAAIRARMRVLDRTPDDPAAAMAVAESMAAAGMLDAARQVLERVVAEHPGDTRPRVQLAHLLIQGNAPGAAVVVARQAVELSGGRDFASLEVLAESLFTVGQVREARSIVEQALPLARDEVERDRLLRLRAAMDQSESAPGS